MFLVFKVIMISLFSFTCFALELDTSKKYEMNFKFKHRGLSRVGSSSSKITGSQKLKIKFIFENNTWNASISEKVKMKPINIYGNECQSLVFNKFESTSGSQSNINWNIKLCFNINENDAVLDSYHRWWKGVARRTYSGNIYSVKQSTISSYIKQI